MRFDVVERFAAPEAMTVAVDAWWDVGEDSRDCVDLVVRVEGRELWRGVVKDRLDLDLGRIVLRKGDALDFVLGIDENSKGGLTERRITLLRDAAGAGLEVEAATGSAPSAGSGSGGSSPSASRQVVAEVGSAVVDDGGVAVRLAHSTSSRAWARAAATRWGSWWTRSMRSARGSCSRRTGPRTPRPATCPSRWTGWRSAATDSCSPAERAASICGGPCVTLTVTGPGESREEGADLPDRAVRPAAQPEPRRRRDRGLPRLCNLPPGAGRIAHRARHLGATRARRRHGPPPLWGDRGAGRDAHAPAAAGGRLADRAADGERRARVARGRGGRGPRRDRGRPALLGRRHQLLIKVPRERGAAMHGPSDPRPSSRRPSTPSPPGASPRSSRCSGHRVALTCCSGPACGPSTARCESPSSHAALPSQAAMRPNPIAPRPHVHPTPPHAPASYSPPTRGGSFPIDRPNASGELETLGSRLC